jgi:hypothetical protein
MVKNYFTEYKDWARDNLSVLAFIQWFQILTAGGKALYKLVPAFYKPF